MATMTSGGRLNLSEFNIDPNREIILTDSERGEMMREARGALEAWMDEFLDRYDGCMLGNGEIIVPHRPEPGKELPEDFAEQLREHADAWDASELVDRWLEVADRSVRLTVWWDGGVVTVQRLYPTGWVEVARVTAEFPTGADHEIQLGEIGRSFIESEHCEAIDDALEDAGLIVSWADWRGGEDIDELPEVTETIFKNIVLLHVV